jgi:cytochrome c biogenesis protein CcdA
MMAVVRRARRQPATLGCVLLGLLALALVDSINPSAIAITLLLLSRQRARTQVAVYVATIFLTYLAFGAMLVLGVDAVLPTRQTLDGGRLEWIVQGVLGLAMLVYAIAAPKTARATAPAEPRASTVAALVVLGVTVTALELPTAMPYFGAVAMITAADLAPMQWLPLLVTYNVVFVLPPLLLLLGHMLLGERVAARYTTLRDRLRQSAHETMLWIMGLVGGGLLVWAIIEYVARFG